MPRQVPMRAIAATIAMVLATVVALLLIHELAKIIAWIVVAAFLAVLLAGPVQFLVNRARLRRSVATMIVFLLGFGLFAGMMYAFVTPLVSQAQNFSDNLPRYVADAQEGRGPVGRLVERYDVEEYIEKNQARLREAISGAGGPALTVVRSIANTVVALVTILVMAFLMVLEGPNILRNFFNLLETRQAERFRRVAEDCAKAVTGYMAGNFLISAVAGSVSFIFLTIASVPFSGVLALWVAFADLIPLVGATLGAVPAIAVAFLHSNTAGVLTIIFFIAYQQFENHVLQVTVMSRTVDLNPLAVLISVLIGVELAGILGALLAIPAAGIIQVIARDIYDERTGRLKSEPTVGADEVPISELEPREQPVKRATKKTTSKAPAKKTAAKKSAQVTRPASAP